MGATSKNGNDSIDTAHEAQTASAIHTESVNAETKEAILEVQRMKAEPTLCKTYPDADTMMKELLQ